MVKTMSEQQSRVRTDVDRYPTANELGGKDIDLSIHIRPAKGSVRFRADKDSWIETNEQNVITNVTEWR